MNTQNTAIGTVEVTLSAGYATISFFHPASNSFPSEQLALLTQTIKDLNKREEIHVIILKSEGEGAFCAGASFDELLQIEDLATGDRFFSGFANVINAMRQSPKLFIGRIHGKTVGGGVGLAAACDYCFANEKASIKLSELAIGIGPFVIEPAVSRKIGKTAVAELSLAAQEWKSAKWAAEQGLYALVCETTEALDEKVTAFAHQLAAYNPEALTAMKRVLWEGTEDWDELLANRAAISGKLVLSDFTKKALLQFKQK